MVAFQQNPELSQNFYISESQGLIKGFYQLKNDGNLSFKVIAKISGAFIPEHYTHTVRTESKHNLDLIADMITRFKLD